MPSSLKCSTKLPGYGLWVTMVSAVTLGSAEFPGWVGGDLEVPPAWEFEVKVCWSKFLASDGERWSKWIEIVHKCSSFCTNSLRSSSYNDGNNSHNYSQFIGKGKSAWNTFKVTTIQVYCLRLSNLSHSLRCFSKSAALVVVGLEFFLALRGLKHLKIEFVVAATSSTRNTVKSHAR